MHLLMLRLSSTGQHNIGVAAGAASQLPSASSACTLSVGEAHKVGDRTGSFRAKQKARC
jgi:hypothetical protein